MALLGHVEDERWAPVLQAFDTHLPPVPGRRPLPRGRQPDDRGHRCAAGEQPDTALRREADQLHEPAHGGPLDVDGGMVAARAARVHGGGEEIGHDPHRRRRRIDPAEEARVAIAHRVREHGRAKPLDDRLGAGAAFPELFLQQRRPLAWSHRTEHRALARAAEVVGHQLDELVTEAAEVLGIDGGWHHLVSPVRRQICVLFCTRRSATEPVLRRRLLERLRSRAGPLRVRSSAAYDRHGRSASWVARHQSR